MSAASIVIPRLIDAVVALEEFAHFAYEIAAPHTPPRGLRMLRALHRQMREAVNEVRMYQGVEIGG